MMFLDEESLTAADEKIAWMGQDSPPQRRLFADAPRPGEPKQLAEKFLLRLRDALETRRHHRGRMMVKGTEAQAKVA